MNIEYELRILEIDVKDILQKLENLGAKKLGEHNFRRYVYGFIPPKDGSFIRLRTDGHNTTLTIKEIENHTINGTKELEMEVSDFDIAHKIFEKLGYTWGYRENRRTSYILDNVMVEIDSWPYIPSYIEIEGKSEEEVYLTIEKLGFKKEDTTAYDILKIYKEVYGIDIKQIKELRWDSI